MNSTNDFLLIDSNFVGLMHFYRDKDHSGKSIDYMFIEEGIIMVIHRENPPSMKTRKKKLLSKKQDYYGKICKMKIGKKLIKNG